VFRVERGGRFAWVGGRSGRVLGKPGGELLGAVAWGLFAGCRRAQFEQHCVEALRTQESTSFEEFDPSVEAWYDVQVHPSDTDYCNKLPASADPYRALAGKRLQ
jgi:hypothetical protein